MKCNKIIDDKIHQVSHMKISQAIEGRHINQYVLNYLINYSHSSIYLPIRQELRKLKYEK